MILLTTLIGLTLAMVLFYLPKLVKLEDSKDKKELNISDSVDAMERWSIYNKTILDWANDNKSTVSKIKMERALELNHELMDYWRSENTLSSDLVDKTNKLCDEMVELFKDDIKYFKDIDSNKKALKRNSKIDKILG